MRHEREVGDGVRKEEEFLGHVRGMVVTLSMTI